jgi:hypothetical protein
MLGTKLPAIDSEKLSQDLDFINTLNIKSELKITKKHPNLGNKHFWDLYRVVD